MNKVKLLTDHGTAKAGEIFVQGLHGILKNYPYTKAEHWYWAQGSTKEENRFLPAQCFEEDNFGIDWEHYN